MGRAVASLVVSVLTAVSTLAVSASLAGCGKDATAPAENLCNRISFSNNPASISIASAPSCTETGGPGFYNNVFDEFGRILSFDFDIQCTAGSSERLVGRVFNVVYNNLGEILSLQATINGRSCSLPD